MDLKCKESAPGGYYYPEHLPVLGKMFMHPPITGGSNSSLIRKSQKCMKDFRIQLYSTSVAMNYKEVILLYSTKVAITYTIDRALTETDGACT